MSEQEFDRTRSTTTTSESDHDVAPNRISRSAQLDAPTHPVASGIVMRKARDGNGVADGADAAVANASTSTGFALPETLMRKFESSLGADLSSVRVHTGGESETAASAVGAKAYTMGQNIHFGAGHYDPSSRSGQTLIAHEVAHTVQQQGGSATRQNKLEVSSPFDAAEHEADRAADAMVSGDSAVVTMASGVQRRPTITIPTVTMTTPRAWDGTHPIDPVFFARQDGDGPEAITANWSGAPALGPMPTKSSGETFESFGKANSAFKTVWDTVQAAWNHAVPLGQKYMTAQANAEAQGLADFGKQSGDLDTSAEDLRFSTHTKVFDAFDIQNNVLAKGKTSFDGAKVSKDLKLDLATAKGKVGEADRVLEQNALDLNNGRLGIQTAVNNVNNAARKLDSLEIDRKIAPEQRMAEAYKRCADLCGEAVKAMGEVTKGETVAKGANAASVGAAGIINTLYWDQQINTINGQIIFLQGQKLSNDLASARADIDNAKIALETAKNNVAKLLVTYKSSCADRAQKYRELGAKLEKAGTQSGLSAKDAEKVSVAVQAKPLIELALKTCQEMDAALPDSLPGEDTEAERGCSVATNRSELIERYGTLRTAKRVIKTSVRKWEGRLASANKLVDAVHD